MMGTKQPSRTGSSEPREQEEGLNPPLSRVPIRVDLQRKADSIMSYSTHAIDLKEPVNNTRGAVNYWLLPFLRTE